MQLILVIFTTVCSSEPYDENDDVSGYSVQGVSIAKEEIIALFQK